MIQDIIEFYQTSHWIYRVFTVVFIVVTINLLVRLVLAEQLYRACSLLANHPYHRA